MADTFTIPELPPRARQAYDTLLEGNARFVSGSPRAQMHTAKRVELANVQEPFAVVLGCSDSRVPVETIFDQEPGNVFVVRLAGNVIDAYTLGSIEYAVAILKASLLLVLGHSSCGAVTAAVDYVKNGARQPGHIQGLVGAIVPAARRTRDGAGDWLARAIAENVRLNMERAIDESSIVAQAVAAGALGIAGAVYDLHTGKVTPS